MLEKRGVDKKSDQSSAFANLEKGWTHGEVPEDGRYLRYLPE